MLWYDTSDAGAPSLKIYSASLASWNTATGAVSSATAPATPVDGMLWYDTSDSRDHVLKAYDGGAWVRVEHETYFELVSVATPQVIGG